jgi:hypothetical protein
MPRYGRAARHELGLLAVHKTVLAAFLKRIKVQWDSFAPTFSQAIGLVCFARFPTEHNELRCPELFRDHSIDQRTAVSDFNFNLIAWLEEFATWHSNSCWCAGRDHIARLQSKMTAEIGDLLANIVHHLAGI